jgi:hypothetical protein
MVFAVIQFKFFLLSGLGLGLIAGIMAYLITYEEYQHHFKGRRVFWESIKSAGITFLFFVLLSLLLGIVLGRISGF